MEIKRDGDEEEVEEEGGEESAWEENLFNTCHG